MEYVLFNKTDEILASPRVFRSKEKAEEARQAWYAARVGQSYLTWDGWRIEAHQVLLEVQEAAEE